MTIRKLTFSLAVIGGSMLALQAPAHAQASDTSRGIPGVEVNIGRNASDRGLPGVEMNVGRDGDQANMPRGAGNTRELGAGSVNGTGIDGTRTRPARADRG